MKHPDKPWSGTSSRADVCRCGGAGVPCARCNPYDDDNPISARDTLMDDRACMLSSPSKACAWVPSAWVD